MADHVQVIAKLPDGERQAIRLAYLGGCRDTYREVAELLDEPEGTVKSRIRSGLEHLRADLVTIGADTGEEQP